MKNVADVVRTDRHLNTLSRGVITADLVKELSGTGPFTIFASSDLAFSKMAPGVFLNFLKSENKVQLTDLLNHHIVFGKTNFKDLKDGQKLKTINGRELNVTVKDNAVSINGAKVQVKDMEGWNGVVHLLDAVIIPS
jgi:uncharacterized surface protein with fasciclin (FAS1) repeats